MYACKSHGTIAYKYIYSSLNHWRTLKINKLIVETIEWNMFRGVLDHLQIDAELEARATSGCISLQASAFGVCMHVDVRIRI